MIIFKDIEETDLEKINDLYGYFDLNTKEVCVNNNLVGYVDFFILDHVLYIRNIRVIERRKGYGTLIIKYLFDNYNIEKIIGYSLDDAIIFWTSLGCIFGIQNLTNLFEIECDNFLNIVNKKL